MTIPRKTLEIAAFWDQGVCLDCEAIQPPDADEATCVSCGSTNVMPCESLLAIADIVEPADVEG